MVRVQGDNVFKIFPHPKQIIIFTESTLQSNKNEHVDVYKWLFKNIPNYL